MRARGYIDRRLNLDKVTVWTFFDIQTDENKCSCSSSVRVFAEIFVCFFFFYYYPAMWQTSPGEHVVDTNVPKKFVDRR